MTEPMEQPTRELRWVGLVILSIASVQLGASVAKSLFGEVPPSGMVWLRLITSAIVLTIVTRPRWRGHSRSDWGAVLGLGLALAVMNWSIYQSFSRIPLGLAVTIEFLGPLGLAVVGSRRLRDFVWAVLAAVGVALLGFSPGPLDLVGVGFALLAGVGWASYIVMSSRVGRSSWRGVSGLAVSSLAATAVMTGPAIAEAGGVLWRPHVLAIGAAVGLLSSVIPYTLELIALRRIPTAVFGILMSLEPAMAALFGLLLLGEGLTAIEMVAMGCVVIASIGATRRT